MNSCLRSVMIISCSHVEVSPTTSVPDVTTSSPTRKETSTQVDVKETIDTHTHPPTTPKIEKEQQTDSSKRLNEQQDSNTVTNETQVSKSKEFDTTTKEDQSTTADHDGQTVQQDSTSSTSQPPVGIEQLPASSMFKLIKNTEISNSSCFACSRQG